MNRTKLIRVLRRYARRNKIHFKVYERDGKGSHYIVEVGSEWTTVQSDLDVFEAERCLKQLKIDPAAL